MTPRRVLLIALGLVVIAWALVPAARAFVLLRNTTAPTYRVEAVDARPLDEVTFRARDGVRLSGSFNVNPAGRGTVILVHGFKSSRAEMIDWFVFLDRAGYSVLL
jgi:hypothetical protein